MKRFIFASSLFVAAACATSFGLGACSSSSSPASPADAAGGGGDEGGGADGGGGPPGYPAPHQAMPQGVTKMGPVMNAPKLITITFQNDTLQASIEKFGNQVALAKDYWTATTSEYGVGPLTAPNPVHLNETPASTLDDTDVQAWLASKIAGDGGAFPQPDGNTIYAIYYPSTTKVTMGGGELCNAFMGYHSDFKLAGSTSTYVTYAVIGRCPPMGVSEMDEVSAEAVHEFIEAATDPVPFEKPAYDDIDAVGKAWALVGGGGELGDVCAFFPDSFFNFQGIDNLVQRTWSNQNAAAGHAPCQPQGVSPYFNSAPQLPDMISVTGTPIGGFTAKGVKIPVGMEKTIELDLYSDAPTSGPWKVTVLDLTSQFFGGAPALSFTMDQTSGQNGDKIQLTIKALSKSSLGAAPFWIQNDLGKQQTFWLGLVAN
jgi:hypothetical protein